MKKVRKNVYLTEDVAEIVEEKSKELGFSQSVYVDYIIRKYHDEQLNKPKERKE